MVRVLVIALLALLNLGYWGWTQDAFAVAGWRPARFTDTEPQRLTQQLRPELLQIRPGPAPLLATPAPSDSPDSRP